MRERVHNRFAMSHHFCDLGNGDQQLAVRRIVVSLPCSENYRSSVKSQESEFCPTESSRKPCQRVVKGKGEAWKRIEEEKNGRGKLGLTAYAIGGDSMEDDFNPLNFFIVEQQKEEGLLSQKRPFGCMLFNYFNILILNVLRGRCDHATPTFVDFKV